MDYDKEKFVEVFGTSNYQYEVVIDSDICLVDDYSDREVFEVYKKFLGQDIRWINPTKENFPRIVIPVKKEGDYKTPMDLVRKFLGQVSFGNNHAKTSERESLLGNKTIDPQLQGNRKLAQLGLPFQFLYREDNLAAFSDLEWLAFSIFREAVNASSEYYQYFNLYKITQIPFIKKDKNGNDKIMVDKFYTWVDSNLDDESKKNMDQYLKSGQKYGQLLKECRDSIGHVEILSNGTVSICPDNIDDYLRIRNMNDIIKNLAIKIINLRLNI